MTLSLEDTRRRLPARESCSKMGSLTGKIDGRQVGSYWCRSRKSILSKRLGCTWCLSLSKDDAGGRMTHLDHTRERRDGANAEVLIFLRRDPRTMKVLVDYL